MFHYFNSGRVKDNKTASKFERLRHSF